GVVDGASLSCSTGTGAPVSTDCNDASSSVYPGASETVADGVDQDCDSVDSCYVDSDNDNYGTTSVTDGSSLSCSSGTGAPVSTDCNDASSSIYPCATEVTFDGFDQSCDGTEICYDDDDDDGYLDTTGDTRTSSDTDCADANEGTSSDLTTDCADTDATRYPGRAEACNDIDDDCDSSVDEGLTTYYADADADGFGTGTADCSVTGVTTGGDCDDTDEWVFPGAEELCDGQQNNCSDAGWTSADENNVVSYVTTAGVWDDYSASFDDATAANYTLPTSGTLYFCPGTYYTKLVGTDASVSVIGRDAATTILHNNASTGSTVSVTRGAVTLEGLTIRGGKGTTASSNTYGGGVLSNATSRPVSSPTVTLVDCVVADNTGTRGAGLAAFGSSWMLLDGTTVQTNAATLGGGAWVATAALLEVTAGSAITSNTATDGAGIYVDGAGDLVIEAASVEMNTATGMG
ncbi:MAG: putative metal-binding motif-containing protein, partial [Myxococcota bacterium]